MNKDNYLIFEAYKNFRTFVSEQEDVDIEKAKEAAKGVRKAADQLDKSLQAARDAEDRAENNTDNQAPQDQQTQTSVMGIPVGGSTPQPTTNTNIKPGTTGIVGAITDDEPVQQPTADTSKYLPQPNVTKPNIAMRASPTVQPAVPASTTSTTTPVPTTGTVPDFTAKSITPSDLGVPQSNYNNPEEAEKKAAEAREKEILAKAQQGQAPTIAAPAPNQGYKQFAQGRRTNAGYRAV